jgi:hypothetical protein
MGRITRNWNEAKVEEGFKFFHMTDFMLNPKSIKRNQLSSDSDILQYCDWDERKKRRVYHWLTTLIRIRIQSGISFVVGKQDYDDFMPEEIKRHYGKDHYAWAVKCLFSEIHKWRKRWGVDRPMQYIFSDMPKGRGGKGEIIDIWDVLRDDRQATAKYGIVKDGFGFQNMRIFPPLQAVDIFAWNVFDHHMNVILKGRDDIADCSWWFTRIRAHRPLACAFTDLDQMQRFVARVMEYKQQTGKFPSPRIERLLEKEERRKEKAASETNEK